MLEQDGGGSKATDRRWALSMTDRPAAKSPRRPGIRNGQLCPGCAQHTAIQVRFRLLHRSVVGTSGEGTVSLITLWPHTTQISAGEFTGKTTMDLLVRWPDGEAPSLRVSTQPDPTARATSVRRSPTRRSPRSLR
ncbi:hypothetical protein San01_09300 [Streptomyces angustmyceticus]|uniref:Uncharacterized protein n=1 Tax=Streptomyces angustmyceticus TaxID=285578 RepID=A0A5J4L300_9ACTN|nr:hypothetical protein San01_09300 [Streptomyces angustmyceticus]